MSISKINFNNLKPLVLSLINSDNYECVFEILEHCFLQCYTLKDYDTLGDLCVISEHRELHVKCAEVIYFMYANGDQLFTARSNLINAYNKINEPEKAMFYVNINLNIKPEHLETLLQKIMCLSLMNKKEESEKLLFETLEKYPESKEENSHMFMGKLLREGHTAKGILSFLNKKNKKSNFFANKFKMTRWEGLIQPGKKIYFEGEGGIGDEIINIRFFKYVKELGMTPILYSTWSKIRKDTVDLFRRHGFEVITNTHCIDQTQLFSSLMCLPGYLNLNETKLWYGPYLFPLKNPKNKLRSKKFKIGIKCSGNPYFGQDEYRKVPLEKMLEYIPDDVEIYYIDTKPTTHSRVIDLSSKINNWEDTLDFIDQMDCIVSSCTSLVHAAGAMGKTTFVVVPIVEYYIWTSTSTTTKSPWYGNNFFVHKQKKLKSWDEPLLNIKNDLNKFIKNI
jgi:hypothetical protein